MGSAPAIRLSGGGGGGGSQGIQKVANAAARAALSPSEGDFAIQLDTDTLYYYNGVAWEIYLDDSSYDDLLTVITGLSNHISDATDAHDASAISSVPAGTLAATDVQAALNELDGDVGTVQTNLTNHINDATDAHDASAISNVPAGTIAATDVQAAVNELDGDIQGHISDATDAHAASAITNTPAGSIAATTVQAAIDELDGDIQGHINDTTDAHAASAISFDDTLVNLGETEVQGAIEELNNRLDGLRSGFESPATITTTIAPTFSRQLTFLKVQGNGAAVTATSITPGAAVSGYVLTLIGFNDTNTVAIDSSTTNVVVKGSCTLGSNDSITFVYDGTNFIEICRNT